MTLALASCLTAVAMGQEYKTGRPAEENRLFVSEAVEAKIDEVTSLLTNQKLIWMFRNCFPNTLDTTVHFKGEDSDGLYDTFVYTGDIHAMWLRDSGAQVWPYIQLAPEDEHLRNMLAGVINRQFKLINIDPYANAFNDGPTGGEWQSDMTEMKLEVHERKWEIDSQCYPIRLAYHYWKTTGDDSVFGTVWQDAIRNILKTLKEQQRKDNLGPYRFLRKTDRQLDTKCCLGWGNPVNPVGLIVSSFRPSDDATTFDFLVPSNFFAVSSLRKAAEILTEVNKDEETASECLGLADEVEKALKKQFAPEFLNRLDDVVYFDQLGKEDIRRITDIELKPLLRRIAEMGYMLHLSDETIERIATEGYDVQYGARPLRRAIQRIIEDPICEMLLADADSETGNNIKNGVIAL